LAAGAVRLHDPLLERGGHATGHLRRGVAIARTDATPALELHRLGRHRWTIERTGTWLGGWRRLRIRYERDSQRFYALVLLACSVICFNALQRPP
jgi:transposase